MENLHAVAIGRNTGTEYSMKKLLKFITKKDQMYDGFLLREFVQENNIKFKG